MNKAHKVATTRFIGFSILVSLSDVKKIAFDPD